MNSTWLALFPRPGKQDASEGVATRKGIGSMKVERVGIGGWYLYVVGVGMRSAVRDGAEDGVRQDA